jgi:hypothetical protein
MAPEIARLKARKEAKQPILPIDYIPTDVYSLGLVFY